MKTLAITLILTSAADDGITPEATARLEAAALAVGRPLTLVVRVDDAPAAWWGDPTDVRIARPILQVDAPASVKLLGAPPAERKTPHDFETGYLRFPWGRKLSDQTTEVAFELVREPAPGERIGLNLVYWLDNADPRKARFVRQRLELELAPGAEAVAGDPTRTSWGPGSTLSVGDEPAFVLPSHDGIELDLAGYRGAPALVVTYRAHW